jgi:hypothetical protein
MSDHARDVGGVRDPNDHRGTAIDATSDDGPGGVVVGILGADDPAGHLGPELRDGHGGWQ